AEPASRRRSKYFWRYLYGVPCSIGMRVLRPQLVNHRSVRSNQTDTNGSRQYVRTAKRSPGDNGFDTQIIEVHNVYLKPWLAVDLRSDSLDATCPANNAFGHHGRTL